MATDKPTIHQSLNQLRKEVARPEEFRLGLSSSKVVTFPDLNAIESEEADALMDRIEAPGKNTWGVVDDWLSEADAKALRAEKLSRAELLHVIAAAARYYREAYGTLGEGVASAG